MTDNSGLLKNSFFIPLNLFLLNVFHSFDFFCWIEYLIVFDWNEVHRNTDIYTSFQFQNFLLLVGMCEVSAILTFRMFGLSSFANKIGSHLLLQLYIAAKMHFFSSC